MNKKNNHRIIKKKNTLWIIIDSYFQTLTSIYMIQNHLFPIRAKMHFLNIEKQRLIKKNASTIYYDDYAFFKPLSCLRALYSSEDQHKAQPSYWYTCTYLCSCHSNVSTWRAGWRWRGVIWKRPVLQVTSYLQYLMEILGSASWELVYYLYW